MTEAKRRKTPVRGVPLDPEVSRLINEKFDQLDLDAAVADLECCIDHDCGADHRRVDARSQLKIARVDPNHRFQPYWHQYFRTWVGLRGGVDASAPAPTGDAATQPPAPPAEASDSPGETGGIVHVVDGIIWTLPTLTKAGAEQARIRLTDLAVALGYSDKKDLKELAARHAQEISDFGETGTVRVSVRQGFTSREFDEPTYNPEQAAYLALSSETKQGRACRVRILKAYKELLARFEQTVTAQPQFALLERTLEALAANQHQTNLLLKTLLERRQSASRARLGGAAQQSIPLHAKASGRVSEKRRNLDSQVTAAACIPPGATAEERERLCREKWHELYHALQMLGINAQLGVVQGVADGDPLETKIDWLERNNYLEEAIAVARRIWRSKPAVRAVR